MTIYDYRLPPVDGTNGADGLNADVTRQQLEIGYNEAYNTSYKDFIYTGGNISEIRLYDTSAMAVYLFNKVLTFTDGNITQVIITDKITLASITRVYQYLEGDIVNITSIYSVPA